MPADVRVTWGTGSRNACAATLNTIQRFPVLPRDVAKDPSVLNDAAEKGRVIVLSLREVEYLDGSAIRVLERMYFRFRGLGARLVVVEPPPSR